MPMAIEPGIFRTCYGNVNCELLINGFFFVETDCKINIEQKQALMVRTLSARAYRWPLSLTLELFPNTLQTCAVLQYNVLQVVHSIPLS